MMNTAYNADKYPPSTMQQIRALIEQAETKVRKVEAEIPLNCGADKDAQDGCKYALEYLSYALSCVADIERALEGCKEAVQDRVG